MKKLSSASTSSTTFYLPVTLTFHFSNDRMAARDEERTAPVEMVDMLIHENNFLRHELNECSQKVSRSIKVIVLLSKV